MDMQAQQEMHIMHMADTLEIMVFTLLICLFMVVTPNSYMTYINNI